MAFIECMQGKAAAGVLKQADVNQLNTRYDQLNTRYKKTMSDEDAASTAAANIVKIDQARLIQKRKNEMRHAQAQERIVEDMLTRATDGKAFGKEVGNLYESAHVRQQSVLKKFLNNLDDFVEEFRSKAAGLRRNTEGIKPVIQELLGKETGIDFAKGHADALRKSFDLAHKEYTNAGGIMGRLDNYFPQVHNRDRMKQVPFEEWYGFVRSRLDVDRMIDENTGLPFTESRLKAVMAEDYDNIINFGRTDLLKRAEEGKQTLGLSKDIAQRREASRFFRFKDADTFLEYNDKFGTGDEGLYDAVIGHFEMTARDTAILQKLGPKPNAMNRHLDLQMAARDVGDTRRKWTNGMYEVLTGRTDGWSGDHWALKLLGGTQNVLRSALLGSAPISAMADSTFIAATARLNGLSAVSSLARYTKQLNPASSADRKLARRSGYIAEIATSGALQDMRFGGENFGGEMTSWLSSFTNRASGLHAMTKGAADALALEMESTLADFKRTNTVWKNLPKEFRDMAKVHNINEADWAKIKKAELFENPDNGVQFLRSMEVSKIDPEVALKVDDWIYSMRAIATNEPTLRTRSITTGAFTGANAKKGTITRAFWGSAFMFKSFPVTVMFNHVLPAFKSAAQGKFEHAATVAVGTTLIGGLAVQLRDIVKGRDPRELDSKFWAAAALQGGGMGLFGDFVFSDYSRFGRDPLVDFLVGPIGGLTSDVLRTFKGNFDRALDDGNDLDKFKRDVFSLAKRNTPAVNLWYSRLLVERLFLDQIEKQIDPQFNRRNRQIENRMYKDFGNKYWWRRGETEPSRGPKI
jgi:hypothetical protein